jgi:DNA-binding transcriptional LysR family regulator
MAREIIDLKKMRAFCLVARYGNLRLAASQLNVTISAVSFNIRRLEEQFGVKLFKRSANRLTLTPEGEYFARSGEIIFDEIANILANPASGIMPHGRLSLSITSDLSWFILPKVGQFLKRYPDVDLRIRTSRSREILDVIERGDADIGIGRILNAPSGLTVKPVVETSISLVCPRDHPLARCRSINLTQLADYKLITLPANHSTRHVIEKAFAQRQLRTKSYVEVSNCQAVREFVLGGIGIGLVHTICSNRESWNAVHCRKLDNIFETVTFSAAYKKYGASPGLLKLLEECMEGPTASVKRRSAKPRHQRSTKPSRGKRTPHSA